MFNPLLLLFLFLLQRRRLRNRPCSRAELSQDAPFVVAIGACILSSLVLPLPSAPNDDEESNSVIDTADARFAVMGIISFIPYFNWLVSFFYFNFTRTTILFSTDCIQVPELLITVYVYVELGVCVDGYWEEALSCVCSCLLGFLLEVALLPIFYLFVIHSGYCIVLYLSFECQPMIPFLYGKSKHLIYLI